MGWIQAFEKESIELKVFCVALVASPQNIFQAITQMTMHAACPHDRHVPIRRRHHTRLLNIKICLRLDVHHHVFLRKSHVDYLYTQIHSLSSLLPAVITCWSYCAFAMA